MNGKSHQLAAAVRVARLLRAALRSSALPAVVMFWAKIVKTFAGRGSTDHLTRGARRAQEHADLHRLHVLTTYYARDGDGEALLNDVLAGAEGKSYEQLKASVSDNLTSQIRTICAAVRASLASPRVPPRVGPRGGGGGGGKVLKDRRSPRERGRMGSSLGGGDRDRASSSSKSLRNGVHHANAVVWEPVTTSSREAIANEITIRLGFACAIQRSTAGAGSGRGLFVRGKVDPGEIVALYPGVAYDVRSVTHLPGFPEVAAANPYLIARFDGTGETGPRTTPFARRTPFLGDWTFPVALSSPARLFQRK